MPSQYHHRRPHRRERIAPTPIATPDTNAKYVSLYPGKSESLGRFHPWVFSGAIALKSEGLQEGERVEVYDAEGQFLAIGHYQIGSIAVRVLSFERETIDETFWTTRLSEAYALRLTLDLAESQRGNIYRLVHGEGDRLPGLVIDV